MNDDLSVLEVAKSKSTPPSKKRIKISDIFSFKLKRRKEIEYLDDGSRLIILKAYEYEDLGKTVIVKITTSCFGNNEIKLVHEDGEVYSHYLGTWNDLREYCLEEDLPKYQDELDAFKRMELDIEIRKLQLVEKYSIWVSQKDQNDWNSAHNTWGKYGMICFDTKAQAQQIIDGILVKKDWSERRVLAENGYYEPTWEKC